MMASEHRMTLECVRVVALRRALTCACCALRRLRRSNAQTESALDGLRRQSMSLPVWRLNNSEHGAVSL